MAASRDTREVAGYAAATGDLNNGFELYGLYPSVFGAASEAARLSRFGGNAHVVTIYRGHDQPEGLNDADTS